METRAYKLRGLSADDFSSDVDRAWSELQLRAKSDPNFAEQLRQDGLDPQKLISEPRDRFFRIEQPTAGLGWEEVVIQFLVELAVTLIDKYILPEIKRGKNREAIQPLPQPKEEPTDSEANGS